MKKTENLNVIIDASWIADRNFKGRITGGAIRVVVEFLNQLGNFPQHNFYLTHQGFLPEDTLNLLNYRNEYLNHANIQVAVVHFKWLRFKFLRFIYVKSFRFMPLWRYISFVPRPIMEICDIYYSPVDSFPFIIRENRKLMKFFTALDLIPLVKPGFSEQFKLYTRKMYDSLPIDTRVLSISCSTKNDLNKYRPDIPQENISITYLGASDNFFFIEDRVLVLSFLDAFSLKEKSYFLTINAIAEYKNFDFILDNFVDFCRERNDYVTKLVVVGLPRELIYKEKLTAKYGSNRQILFLQDLSDHELNLLYNGALAFLYMSLYEGFGLPILEAMQCGCPVICSNTSSMPEVVGNAGLMCDPHDVISFKNHLFELLKDEILFEILRKKGLLQSKKFSWNVYTNNVIKAFENSIIV